MTLMEKGLREKTKFGSVRRADRRKWTQKHLEQMYYHNFDPSRSILRLDLLMIIVSET